MTLCATCGRDRPGLGRMTAAGWECGGLRPALERRPRPDPRQGPGAPMTDSYLADVRHDIALLRRLAGEARMDVTKRLFQGCADDLERMVAQSPLGRQP